MHLSPDEELKVRTEFEALVNLAPAFSDIHVRTYVLATFLGVIPGTFVFANLGASLASIDSVQGLLSARTLSALGLLGVLALTPVVVRHFWRGPGEGKTRI